MLAIDAGNTRVKWGVHDGRSWRSTGVIATADTESLDDELRGVLPGGAAFASNVAGPEVEAAIESACKRAKLTVTFVRSERERLGVTNGYRDAAQLGADRWAALIAAHHAQRGHKLVVNAGTALTVDALTDEGRFLGGLIVAGPALMRRSLDRGTAALREAHGAVRDFPDNTPDAIETGCLLAQAGAVEKMFARLGASGLCLLSGGGASALAPHLGIPLRVVDDLVLEGLARIAESPA